jgi:hypothetical protein
MINDRPVLSGSYSLPRMRCADTSAKKYITSALQTCTTYGLFRCARPYAWKARVTGPRRSKNGNFVSAVLSAVGVMGVVGDPGRSDLGSAARGLEIGLVEPELNLDRGGVPLPDRKRRALCRMKP